MDGDDLDGVAFGVDAAFIAGRAVSPIAAEIADELLQSLHAIGPRAFENGLDVGGRAGAAVAFARAQDRRTARRSAASASSNAGVVARARRLRS